MDPVSVAASVIAIAGAVSSVSQGFSKCAKALLYAKEEVLKFAGELAMFSNMLRSLDRILQGISKPLLKKLRMKRIYYYFKKTAWRTIKKLEWLLKDMKKLAQGSFDGLQLLERIRWYFKRPLVLLRRSELETIKINLSIWMSILHLGIAVDKSNKDPQQASQLQDFIETIKGDLEVQRNLLEKQQEEQNKVLSKLQQLSSQNTRNGLNDIILYYTADHRMSKRFHRVTQSRPGSAGHLSPQRPDSPTAGLITTRLNLGGPGHPFEPSGAQPPVSDDYNELYGLNTTTRRIATSISPSGQWEFEETVPSASDTNEEQLGNPGNSAPTEHRTGRLRTRIVDDVGNSEQWSDTGSRPGNSQRD